MAEAGAVELGRSLRPPARVVLLCGFMAAGKSHVGRLLAAATGLRLIDTDDLVEARAGRRVADIFEQDGEAAFRELESAALAEAVAGEPAIVATGGGMMERPDNVALMRQAGPILWLRVSAEDVLARTAGDNSRPLLQVADQARQIRELLARRDPIYAQADHVVDTSGRSGEEAALAALDLLAGDPRVAALLRRLPLAVPVEVPGAPYRVVLGHGLLGQATLLLEAVAAPPERAAVVTAEGPCADYAATLAGALAYGGCRAEVVAVPDGEASKSLEELASLYSRFAAMGLDRASWVFAVGGGVVGDLAGMAAATYMRGLPLAQVPTTLLAQVDSSLGGKVAVNLAEGKNLVGAFYQPRLVLADLAALDTLPAARMQDGLAEGIKHAALFDAELFEWLEAHGAEVAGRDPVALRYFVARNVQLKAGVVSRDPKETGLRALLNYGHTVGHALERAARGWSLSHGAAVAVGMVAEATAAAEARMAEEDLPERLRRLLAAVGLPAVAPEVDLEAAQAALGLDKKILRGVLRLPVVEAPGRSLLAEVAPDFLAGALRRAAVRAGGATADSGSGTG